MHPASCPSSSWSDEAAPSLKALPPWGGRACLWAPGSSAAVLCKPLPEPSSLLASPPVPLPPGAPLSEQSGGRDFGGKWIWQRSRDQTVVQLPSFPYLFPPSQDKRPYEGPGTWRSLRVFVRKPPYLELMDPNLVTKKEVETPSCPVSHGHDLGAVGPSFAL